MFLILNVISGEETELNPFVEEEEVYVIIQIVRVGNQGRWRLEVVLHNNIIIFLVLAFKNLKAFKNLCAIMIKLHNMSILQQERFMFSASRC